MEDLNLVPSHMYKLYSKGLVSEDVAGFGFAICDQDDKLLLQMKGPIHDFPITSLEAELTALIRGLTAVAGLAIDHLSIYTNHDHIYRLVLGRYVPQEENIPTLVGDLLRIRQQFTSCDPVLVTKSQIKFAYELAMETTTRETSIDMHILSQSVAATHNETCHICFDDGLESHHMLSAALCGHQFCKECTKRHIEAKLSEGVLPGCPHYQCESKLLPRYCADILTPKLKEMWGKTIKEESIPVEDRVYCPNPICSALMSKTELSESNTEEVGVKSCCVLCGQPLCINCKVPWHNNLSCDGYKRLGPNSTENDMKLMALADEKGWRQCRKCKQIIERTLGCVHVTCRCGYSFCYECGKEWKVGGCSHNSPISCPAILTFIIIMALLVMLYTRVLTSY